ncbi:PREDICTED: uncharacterized protein LOC105592122 [Cercocebus atys]|uniref:uncharacterized protein LOC105592122 n=1 Tax=Cercocebus atys TaxID=9531 RepID=UPI0005F55EBD|nr:PREDICTED: uncharacterized protein LOC105592122 [Cercocebus atys]
MSALLLAQVGRVRSEHCHLLATAPGTKKDSKSNADANVNHSTPGCCIWTMPCSPSCIHLGGDDSSSAGTAGTAESRALKDSNTGAVENHNSLSKLPEAATGFPAAHQGATQTASSNDCWDSRHPCGMSATLAGLPAVPSFTCPAVWDRLKPENKTSVSESKGRELHPAKAQPLPEAAWPDGVPSSSGAYSGALRTETWAHPAFWETSPGSGCVQRTTRCYSHKWPSMEESSVQKQLFQWEDPALKSEAPRSNTGFTSCVTLRRLLSISDPLCPQLSNEAENDSQACCECYII